MKYTVRMYAAALIAALDNAPEKEREKIIRRFLLALRRNRDLPRLRRIIQAAEKEYFRAEGLRKIVVESADGIPQEAVRRIKGIFQKKALLEEKKNRGLLAGVRILVDDELLIDASAQRQIAKLF